MEAESRKLPNDQRDHPQQCEMAAIADPEKPRGKDAAGGDRQLKGATRNERGERGT